MICVLSIFHMRNNSIILRSRFLPETSKLLFWSQRTWVTQKVLIKMIRYKYTHSCKSMEEKALAGYYSQQIQNKYNIQRMLIIISLLKWKHFCYHIVSIPNPNNELYNAKGTYDKHISIFTQLNFIHRWFLIIFHIDFEEVHNENSSRRTLWHTYQYFSIH